MKAVVVTVTYGDRYKFLVQVVDALFDDPLVSRIIVIDNGSHQSEQIRNLAASKGEKIKVISFDKNKGFAIGFSEGIQAAQEEDATHVLLLDDDNVPEKGALSIFSGILAHLASPEKIVICGDRTNLVGNERYFFEEEEKVPTFTFFDVVSIRKLKYFLKVFSVKKHGKKDLFSVDSFAYGGALIPIEAIRNAPLPNRSLVLYGDDIEYSWNIKKLGYTIYASTRPRIYDIDLTFGTDNHISGLFDKNTKPFKVFYRIRNMVYLSLRHSRQSKSVLYLNMCLWFTGLFLLGLLNKKAGKGFFKRSMLILQAARSGFEFERPIPAEVSLP